MNNCENKTCEITDTLCPDVRVCERVIMHDVNHIMPIHTKIINRHVFKHTYTPVYTCEEVSVCENVTCPCNKTSIF